MTGNSKITALVIGSLVAGVAVGGVGVNQVLSNASQNGSFATRAAIPSIPTQLRLPSSAPAEASTIAPSLSDLDAQFSDVVGTISPSVVHVRSDRGGQGSGVVYRQDGWIITNDHVVSDGGTVTVVLANGKEYQGKVTRSRDSREDIAVVKIDAKGLVPAPFADSRDVKPGQYAIAVGAPFGLENTVTIGHVSALGRQNVAGGMGELRQYENMIQTDAAINPGNSGGPLLNVRGEVIGINTAIYSSASMFGGAGGNVGIGFAIPASQTKLIADLLISRGTLDRGFLGIRMEPLRPFELEEKGIRGGVRVFDLASETASPARTAGLKKGDIITRVGRDPISNPQDIMNAMLTYSPGTTVDVEYLREGQRRTAKVKIISMPASVANSFRTPESPRNQRQSPFGSPDGNLQMPEDAEKWMEEFRRFRSPEGQDQPNERQTPPANPGRPGTARLGVATSDVNAENRKQFFIPQSIQGAVIMEVENESVAAEHGLKPGMVITRVGTTPIRSAEDLVSAIAKLSKGQRVNVTRMEFGENRRSEMTGPVQF